MAGESLPPFSVGIFLSTFMDRVHSNIRCVAAVRPERITLIIAEVAADYILKAQPDFVFIYLERTDWVEARLRLHVGIISGCCQTADQAVGLLLEALIKAELMDQYDPYPSDHGGSGYHHMDVSVRKS
jgi:hypothetical protein